jgi:serine/threonine protein kinase
MGSNFIFKTADITKRHDAIQEFEREVEVYKHLEDLQGKVIPKFIASGSYQGILKVIVLERLHRQISQSELETRKSEINQAIAMINDKMVSHNDLRQPNIMVDFEGKIRIIDFGMSEIRDVPGFRESV